ncbi:MAG: hypothetical protein JNN17_01900 [Verrucomicrobiaceae bacterium]|nr:hypothetical protein [Verrucomicrobiaceae bacterium]
MRHPQVTKSVEVVPFDDEIVPAILGLGCAQLRVQVQRHEVGIDGLVPFDLIGLPNEAKACGIPAVPSDQETHEFIAGEVLIFPALHHLAPPPSIAHLAIRAVREFPEPTRPTLPRARLDGG